MDLSSQLNDAMNDRAMTEEASGDGKFFTPATFKSAVSGLPARLEAASGGPWDTMKTEGPKSHEITGGTETYVLQKWYPKDRKQQMVADLTVTMSAGKYNGVFSIESKGKQVYHEKKSAPDLGTIVTWIDGLVSPE